MGHDASVPSHPTLQLYRVSDKQARPWVQHACNIGTHGPVRKGPALLVVPYKKASSSRPVAEAGLPGSSPPSARLPRFPLWAAISSAGPRGSLSLFQVGKWPAPGTLHACKSNAVQALPGPFLGLVPMTISVLGPTVSHPHLPQVPPV